MKNPFRKAPLTDANLKRIREQGDPYTRLLIPLGRKRVIALVGFTERELHDEFETWMEEVEDAKRKAGRSVSTIGWDCCKNAMTDYDRREEIRARREDAERQAGRVVEFGHAKPWGEPLKDGESVADVTTVSSERREWVRCMGDDGKGCRASYAHCICIDDPQPVMADWDGRGIETPLLPQSDGEGASMACMRPVRVSTIPPRGSTVPGGGIEPLYDPEGSFERRKLYESSLRARASAVDILRRLSPSQRDPRPKESTSITDQQNRRLGDALVDPRWWSDDEGDESWDEEKYGPKIKDVGYDFVGICGDVSQHGKVCVEPEGHTGVHKGAIEDGLHCMACGHGQQAHPDDTYSDLDHGDESWNVEPERKYLADMRAAGVPIHDLPVNACADLPDPGLVERPEGMTHDGLDRRFTCVNCDRPYAEHRVGAIGAPLWCPSAAGLLAGMWKQKPR